MIDQRLGWWSRKIGGCFKFWEWRHLIVRQGHRLPQLLILVHPHLPVLYILWTRGLDILANWELGSKYTEKTGRSGYSKINGSNSGEGWPPRHSMYVRSIYLHLVDSYGTLRYTDHTLSVWDNVSWLKLWSNSGQLLSTPLEVKKNEFKPLKSYHSPQRVPSPPNHYIFQGGA